MAEQIFAGVGLGILTGLLVGLTSSPVVASLVGALAAAIVALLGLGPNEGAKRGFAPGSPLRVGAFGFSCAMATLFGLYIRTHDLLSPTAQEQIASLNKAGFDVAQAKQWVLVKRFGIRTSETSASATPYRAGDVGVGASVLFSDAGIDNCQVFDPDNYKDSRQQLAHLQTIGGHYAAFAAGIRGLGDPDKAAVLKSTRLLFCPE